MKSLESRIALATALLAAGVAHSALRVVTQPESPQFERFENQMQMNSAPSYTPSEHPDAKPAPKSSLRSVFDDPINTASPG